MRLPIAAAALAAAVVSAPALAGEVYGAIGLPGASLGFAQPLDGNVTLRADWTTLGDRSRTTTEEGIAYDARLKANRLGLFADWFAFGGGFRLTGGITSNDYRLDLVATGAGGSLTIGDTTYVTSAADRFEAVVKFDRTTPYLGIGWGHHAGSGWRFAADLGVMIGKAKVSTALSGPAASQVSQADIDKETAELRDGVAKVRAVPQIGIAIGYSF